MRTKIQVLLAGVALSGVVASCSAGGGGDNASSFPGLDNVKDELPSNDDSSDEGSDDGSDDGSGGDGGNDTDDSTLVDAAYCKGARLTNSPFANSDDATAGTQANPFRICTFTQLDQARTALSAHFALHADIDASSSETAGDLVDPDNTPNSADEYYTGFVPIGSDAAIFKGAFDGRGHSISGLHINRPTVDHIGLFGNICDYDAGNPAGAPCNDGSVVIKDTLVLDAHIVGKQGTGALVGYGAGSTISGCRSTGTVYGSRDVGGLVGDGEQATMTDISSSVDVTASDEPVGGLIGGGDSMYLSACFATGSVSGPGCAGGLVGWMGAASRRPVLRHCFATGAVTGSGSGHAGLVGWAGGLDAKYVYATGNVTVTGTASNVNNQGGLLAAANSYQLSTPVRHTTLAYSFARGNVFSSGGGLGGLVGVNIYSVEDSYATGAVSGYAAPAGLVGWNQPGTVSRSYASGTVTNNGGGTSAGLVAWAQGDAMDHSFAVGNILGGGSPNGRLASGGTLVAENFVANYHSTDAVFTGTAHGTSVSTGKALSYFKGPVTLAGQAGGVYETWDFTNTWRIAAGELPKLRCPTAQGWPFDCATTWDAAQQ